MSISYSKLISFPSATTDFRNYKLAAVSFFHRSFLRVSSMNMYFSAFTQSIFFLNPTCSSISCLQPPVTSYMGQYEQVWKLSAIRAQRLSNMHKAQEKHKQTNKKLDPVIRLIDAVIMWMHFLTNNHLTQIGNYIVFFVRSTLSSQ